MIFALRFVNEMFAALALRIAADLPAGRQVAHSPTSGGARTCSGKPDPLGKAQII